MKTWAIFLSILMGTTGAAAQTCTAGLATPPAGWTPAQSPSAGKGSMTVLAEAVCTGCERRVVAQVSAGPAPESFRATPIGQLTGLRLAETVVADPAQRFGFLESVLRSLRRNAPSCTIDGQVDNVARVTSPPTVVTNIRAQCTTEPREINGLIYTAYDGTCFYQVELLWSSFADLSASDRERLFNLLKAVRFGS